MHLKGADSMGVSGPSFRNALVGSVLATAVLLCTNELHGSLYSSLGEQLLAECCHYCKLFNEWV